MYMKERNDELMFSDSIQIDESLWVHHGKMVMENREDQLSKLGETIYDRQRWVFGIVEENNNGFKLGIWCVKDRSAETIEAILESHVAPGTTVHSDGWGAYEAVNWD